MNTLAAGFWGCFFGTAALMLLGSAVAYARSLRRIAINAGLAAVVSVFFALSFLGALPIADAGLLARSLAHLTALTAALLLYLLLSMLGFLKTEHMRTIAVLALASMLLGVIGWSWMMSPTLGLGMTLGAAGLLGGFALAVCLRNALRGDRLAWAAVAGVSCMLLAMGGLGWIALDRTGAPWEVHVASAVAATLYLAIMAWVLWARYAYLIELHQVMAFGPSYDPITRMRSHSETGHLVGAVFKSLRDEPAPLGVIVVTIANFYALDKLHGQAAVNHVLFVTAARLRRVAPAGVEMGRLGPDGFVLIMRKCSESGWLIDLARLMSARLCRTISLHTRNEAAQLETLDMVWSAEIGVGVLLVSDPATRGSSAIAMARGMSRTAMSYESRVAWFDHSSGEIVELPLLAPF